MFIRGVMRGGGGGKLLRGKVIACYCSSEVVALNSVDHALFYVQVQSACRRRCIS